MDRAKALGREKEGKGRVNNFQWLQCLRMDML